MQSSRYSRFPFFPASVALQIFLAFFVIYAVTSSGGLEVSDGETRFRTAQSWVEGHGGALSPVYGPIGVPGRDGRQYSLYGPFQSILMAPFVATISRVAPGHLDQLFKLVFGAIVIPALAALSLAVLFHALRSLRFGERAAFGTVAMMGLATPLWHYARSGQEELIIGLAFALYLWGMGLLYQARYTGLNLVALAASIVFATRWSYLPTLFFLSLPVAAQLWQRQKQWRLWSPALATGSALFGLVMAGVLWYNTYRFGHPFETGYGVYFRVYPEQPFFTFGAAPSHIAALALSPYRGMLWFCPTLLLLFGLRKVPKGATEMRLWKPTLGAWAFTWLFIGSFSFWNGGPAWGPRYLVALLVLLAPAFASVFESGQRWTAVIAVSVLVQFCSTVLPSSTEDFEYDTRNLEQPGVCSPWKCQCGALCLRGPSALRAIGNTLASRPLPVIELSATSKAGGASALQTSDFNSVYWWPVRAAYRAHKLTPSLAFVICLVLLTGACSALWLFFRRLPTPRLPGTPVEPRAAL